MSEKRSRSSIKRITILARIALAIAPSNTQVVYASIAVGASSNNGPHADHHTVTFDAAGNS